MSTSRVRLHLIVEAVELARSNQQLDVTRIAVRCEGAGRACSLTRDVWVKRPTSTRLQTHSARCDCGFAVNECGPRHAAIHHAVIFMHGGEAWHAGELSG